MSAFTTPVTTPDKSARPLVPKQSKPYDDFPLYWHPRGYWMCKRNGEEWRYTADWRESLDRYSRDRDTERAGATRQQGRSNYLLRDAVNAYLSRQKRRFERGQLSAVQFAKCRLELERNLKHAVPLSTPLRRFRATGPGDEGPGALFHAIHRRAIGRGLQVAHRHVTIVRAMLDYAANTAKLCLAPDYGDEFDPPRPSEIDRDRSERDQERGERAWSAAELRTILAAAKRNPHLYAQILLGLFAGYGSDDCSAVPESAMNGTVLKFPRVKNGRRRVAILPDRVVRALKASMAARPAQRVDGLMFVTAHGSRCNAAAQRHDEKGLLSAGRNDTIGKNFTRLVKRIGLYRAGAGFKTLRAMCRTMMVGAGVDSDLIAVVMGRSLRHRVDDYYLRGDLRAELEKIPARIEKLLFASESKNAIASVSIAARSSRL